MAKNDIFKYIYFFFTISRSIRFRHAEIQHKDAQKSQAKHGLCLESNPES